MKSTVLATALASSIASASSVYAGDTTFPGETSFTFAGFPGTYNGVSNTPILEVCANNLGVCHESPGDTHASLTSDRVVARFLDQRVAGAAIRGDIYNQDPGGYAMYHSLEFELITDNFFTQNPGAHIAIAPRSFMPYQINGTQYNNYAPFTYLSGTTIKFPYAYGEGIILGNVPCKSAPGVGYLGISNLSNGVAEEIFLNPANPHDTTACPQSQISLENNATYIDRSSWFISHILTSKTNRWSFKIKNLQAKASNTAPSWWTNP